jgi:hypothetical protein
MYNQSAANTFATIIISLMLFVPVTLLLILVSVYYGPLRRYQVIFVLLNNNAPSVQQREALRVHIINIWQTITFNQPLPPPPVVIHPPTPSAQHTVEAYNLQEERPVRVPTWGPEEYKAVEMVHMAMDAASDDET